MAVDWNTITSSQPSVSNVGATVVPKPATPKPVSAKAPKTKKPTARKKAPPKKQSATQKYLAGDTTYQQQLSDFNRSKADYTSNYNRQTGIINRDYASSQRALNQQGVTDRADQQNDFAGRGILHSGVFASALGDYNTQFNHRVQDLSNGKTDQLGDLSAQQKSFLAQLQMQMNAARQDAIRRRAANLGI
jgi:hypothetical protein